MNKLTNILSSIKPKKIFLVTGRSSYIQSGAEKFLSLALRNYSINRFNDFSSNPKLEDVKRGIAIYKKNKPDLVIAVGGGNVIDMAKLINILSIQNGEPEDYIKAQKIITKRGEPFIAIPTTAGSGSEATQFAVAYIGKKKYSVGHKYILPDYVVLEPRLTLTLPPQTTASSGIDALSQAIESYWSVNSTKKSKLLSKKAIPLILKNLPLAYQNPNNLKYRKAMMTAANLAGKAINITRTTAPHALSYVLTSYFGIDHGHAVGIFLGDILVLNSKANKQNTIDKRGHEYVRKIIKEICVLLGIDSLEKARFKIKNLMNSIGLETRLSKLGVKKKDFNLIVKNVNFERLKNNPVKINEEVLINLLESIY